MAQTRAAKEQVVEALSARLAEAQSIYLTDFTGLNVEKVTQLRHQLRAEHIECRVVKNTLMRFAVRNAGLSGLDAYLEGPTALILSEDPVAPARVLHRFKRAHDGCPGIKGGLLNGAVIEAEQIQALATLPSKEELIRRTVGGIAAPLTGLVYSLSGMMGNLVRVLSAIAARQPSEASAAD